MAPIITLLTDFGYRDSYVGVMKGVMADICPAAQLIDLTHAMPPQNVLAARFTLLTAYPYFPGGTVHLAVVDPGVGTERRAIALQTPHGYLVGPDNGLFSGVLQQVGAIAAVTLTHSQYWRTVSPSATFHGRDIFAPVAAHLAAGVPLQDLGEAIAPEALVMLDIPQPTVSRAAATGHIQHIDHFGNLITTIPASAVQSSWRLQVGQLTIPLGHTYSAVDPGHLVALGGSHGWVEIAVNGGSAWEYLQLAVGDEVRIHA